MAAGRVHLGDPPEPVTSAEAFEFGEQEWAVGPRQGGADKANEGPAVHGVRHPKGGPSDATEQPSERISTWIDVIKGHVRQGALAVDFHHRQQHVRVRLQGGQGLETRGGGPFADRMELRGAGGDGAVRGARLLEQGACMIDVAPAQRDPRTYLSTLAPIAVIGEGVAYHRDAIDSIKTVSVLPEELNRPRAEIVHRLGRAMAANKQFIEIADLIPIYIRRPEAEEKLRCTPAS